MTQSRLVVGQRKEDTLAGIGRGKEHEHQHSDVTGLESTTYLVLINCSRGQTTDSVLGSL